MTYNHREDGEFGEGATMTSTVKEHLIAAPKRQVVWAVKTNSDLDEGRGREYVAHFCKLQATAVRMAKRGYVQGSDCPVQPVDVLVLDGKHVLPMSMINVVPPSKEDEVAEQRLWDRDAALMKAKSAGLTDAEIKLLARV